MQDKENGGISDRPDNAVDVYHTYFGVAGQLLIFLFFFIVTMSVFVLKSKSHNYTFTSLSMSLFETTNARVIFAKYRSFLL